MSTGMDLPRGWKLEEPDDQGYTGTIGVLRRADEPSLKLARRYLREIPEEDVEGQGLHLLDKTTGETLEVVTSFVDLVDPRLTGTTAFTVRDSLLVPLRPVGWKNEKTRPTSPASSAVVRRRAAIPCPCPSGGCGEPRAILESLPEEVVAACGLGDVGESGPTASATGDGPSDTSQAGGQLAYVRTSRPAAELQPSLSTDDVKLGALGLVRSTS